MSLKEFHIVFITLAIALAVGLGLWAVGMYWSTVGSSGYLATAILSLFAASALAVYAVGFVRKARRMGLR